MILMISSHYFALIQNACILLAMAVVFDTTLRGWNSGGRIWRKFFLGLVVGAIGIVLMNTPWTYGEGLIFDTRSILLSMSGLFFGTIPTLVAMVICALYRFSQGGAYLTGISVIIATSLIGILWHHWKKNSLVSLRWWELYIFGIVVHVVMILLMFTQPIETALPLVAKLSPPVMIIYPVGTLLLGLLMVNRVRREQAVFDNLKTQTRLKSMVNILQHTVGENQAFVDHAMEEAIILTDSQLGFIFYYSESDKKFRLSSWSKIAMELCKISDPQVIYDLENTGIWGEPVRQRKPIILNKFAAHNPLKKGYPEGHPAILRLLEIPVFVNDEVVAVVGMANKATDYTEADVVQLSLFMDTVWKSLEREKAIQAVKTSEEKYRHLFNQAADGIFITSRDGDFLEVNESGCRILGYSLDEIRENYLTVFRAEDPGFHIEDVVKELQSGKQIHTERKFSRKDGRVIDLEISTQLLSDGRVEKVFRDISERKKAAAEVAATQHKLQELLKISDESRKALLSVIEDQKQIEEALRKSENSYRNLFENITQGFALHRIITDDQGIPVDYEFLAANPAYEQLTGLRSHDIVGKRVREVLPGVEQEWIDTFGKVALTGEPVHFENFTAAIGKYYEVIAFCPEPRNFAVVISDISERKKYEQEMQNFNLELENRVKLRTAELETANRELESFSYSVSHDLRAPLRSINGFSQIIVEEYKDQLSEEISHYFDLIRKNSAMMGDLVDDLLNFSRLGRQALKTIQISPLAVIQDVLESMQEEISQRHIQVEIRDLPDCQADPALIKQVYVNLISNAVKFTRKQITPQIEIGFLASHPNRSGEDVANCYYVKDNGVGFDMQFYDKLFGVFNRLHRSEDYEGTGVGLAIVERIIKKHNGTIWAESQVDRGTIFYFTLGEPNDGS